MALLQKIFGGYKIQYDKGQIIGRGGYGYVFRGTFNKIQVAVKRVQLVGLATREEEALSRLDHPNIVKLFYWEDQAGEFR